MLRQEIRQEIKQNHAKIVTLKSKIAELNQKIQFLQFFDGNESVQKKIDEISSLKEQCDKVYAKFVSPDTKSLYDILIEAKERNAKLEQKKESITQEVSELETKLSYYKSNIDQLDSLLPKKVSEIHESLYQKELECQAKENEYMSMMKSLRAYQKLIESTSVPDKHENTQKDKAIRYLDTKSYTLPPKSRQLIEIIKQIIGNHQNEAAKVRTYKMIKQSLEKDISIEGIARTFSNAAMKHSIKMDNLFDEMIFKPKTPKKSPAKTFDQTLTDLKTMLSKNKPA